jgi:hypothetical protein
LICPFDALLVVQVPLAAGMHGEDHEQRVSRRSGLDRLSPAPKIRATSSGTVKGDAMTLTVVVESKSQRRRNTDFFVGKKAT